MFSAMIFGNRSFRLATEPQAGDSVKLLLRDVCKTFPTRKGTINAIENVSLEVGSGEFLCLVGPSGCGKSTLLSIIAGLEKPDKGQALVNGSPIVGPGRDRILIFQELALFPWLSVIKNVEFGLRMASMPPKEREQRALQFLKMVHLSRFQHAYVHELSGGMKQRVALARALALDPEILLMDEPFAALDAQTRDILHEELQEIWAATRKTIIFVTHNVREAACLGNRVVVLATQPGRIKREFQIELGRPRHIEDPSLIAYAKAILSDLKEEVEKVAKEELDYDWRVASKRHLLRADDRDLGGGI